VPVRITEPVGSGPGMPTPHPHDTPSPARNQRDDAPTRKQLVYLRAIAIRAG
jgi:hypothetical protein